MKNEAYDHKPDPRTVGAAIRRIRRKRHIKQYELARRVGIQPGPLSGIETGKNIPSGRVLYALAAELNVPIDAFFNAARKKQGAAVRESSPVYRSGPASTRPGVEQKELPETARRLCGELMDVYLALEDICGAQKRAMISLELPFTADEFGVEQLSNQVRQMLGIGQAIVFDYLELFENAGLRVIFCDLPETVESWSYYDEENGNAFFFIRRGMNAEKQLFRLVYELGRVYLCTHHDLHRTTVLYGKETQPKVLERTARKFAAFFLMPAIGVRTTVGQLAIRPDEWSYELALRLKHRFGISAESFIIRLEELCLITPALADFYKQNIYAHYLLTAYAEPAATRRILTPNGRLGDLLLCAVRKEEHAGEVAELRLLLQKHCALTLTQDTNREGEWA